MCVIFNFAFFIFLCIYLDNNFEFKLDKDKNSLGFGVTIGFMIKASDRIIALE